MHHIVGLRVHLIHMRLLCFIWSRYTEMKNDSFVRFITYEAFGSRAFADHASGTALLHGMSLSPMHWRHCLLLSHGITTLLLWTRGATAFRHLQQSTKDSNKAPFTAHELKWSGQVDPVTPLVMHIHSPAHATSTYFVLIGRRHSELCMHRSHSHSRIKTTLGMMLQQWRRVD